MVLRGITKPTTSSATSRKTPTKHGAGSSTACTYASPANWNKFLDRLHFHLKDTLESLQRPRPARQLLSNHHGRSHPPSTTPAPPSCAIGSDSGPTTALAQEQGQGQLEGQLCRPGTCRPRPRPRHARPVPRAALPPLHPSRRRRRWTPSSRMSPMAL